jgi:hypothetical protein
MERRINKMTLKDKVELYERILKKLAEIDVEKECLEALTHPNNIHQGEAFISRYPFAFGMVGQAYKNVVTGVRLALLDTGIEWRK